MKTKPMFFNLMSITFCLMAMALPLQIWAIYQVNDLNMVLSKMTYLNWLLVFLFASLSLLSFKVSKAILYLLPVTCSIVIFNNWTVSTYGNNFSVVHTLLASIGFAILCGPYYLPKFKSLLTNNKQRWWEPAKRIQKSLPVHIIHNKNQINSLSFDISESGIFIQQDSEIAMSQIAIGQVIKMQIHLPEGTINCDAEVVRKTDLETGNYPAGLGLRFLDPSEFLKQSINDSLTEEIIH